MRIWVRPDTLAKLQLTVTDLIDAIQAQNVGEPGRARSAPSRRPRARSSPTPSRAQGRLVKAEQFGEIIVRANPDGSFVRLRDVARIELGSQNYMQLGRFQGKPAAIVAVYQAPGSNALATADGLKTQMEELATRFPPDLAYDVALDTTLPVSEGINEIVHTLVEAMVLVILVVFLFLQGWRATLIPLIAVPVSLVGAFSSSPCSASRSTRSRLLGLVLAIGLVVDDAIVVVEAVEVGIEHGLSPRDATIKAMDEVSAPVIGIALILAAVFIPAGFMTGITGSLYQQFAITIAISVLISAFNALTLSPALSALLLRPKQPARGPLGRFFAAFNRGFDARPSATSAAPAWPCARPGARMLAARAHGRGGAARRRLPTSFVPERGPGLLLHAGPAARRRVAAAHRRGRKRVEQILGETEGVQRYTTIVGFSLLSNISATYNAFYFVQLDPWEERGEPETQPRRSWPS